MTQPGRPLTFQHPRPPRSRSTAVIVGVVAVLAGLGGCNAVRQAPADLQYSGDAVVTWVADVVGYQPPEY